MKKPYLNIGVKMSRNQILTLQASMPALNLQFVTDFRILRLIAKSELFWITSEDEDNVLLFKYPVHSSTSFFSIDKEGTNTIYTNLS